MKRTKKTRRRPPPRTAPETIVEPLTLAEARNYYDLALVSPLEAVKAFDGDMIVELLGLAVEALEARAAREEVGP